MIHIGCAGWALPKAEQAAFPAEGTHLQRYAARFNAVEINSSFYRPHQPATYARWADSVPASFRFSVKVPKAITHERRLVDAEALLDAFLAQAGALGDRLGCLLVQLPPSLKLAPDQAEGFFKALRQRHTGPVALEPRHASWFTDEAVQLLKSQQISRVAADPALLPAASEPSGDVRDTAYFRLHGSPRIYYSAYDEAALDAIAQSLTRARGHTDHVWCIFDNTALGAATANALALAERLLATPTA
ncbi:MAG: DUF72 domain-containing protein [Rubrivivax sp.]|nr:MAG: DUF72 domain-containing protein [Rubrivivax sp.]